MGYKRYFPKSVPITISPVLTEHLMDYIFTWTEAEKIAPVTLSDAVYFIRLGRHNPECPKEYRASPKLIKDVRKLLDEVRVRFQEDDVLLHRAESGTRLPGQKIVSWSSSLEFVEGLEGKVLTRRIPSRDIIADPEVTKRYSPDVPPDTEFLVWED